MRAAILTGLGLMAWAAWTAGTPAAGAAAVAPALRPILVTVDDLPIGSSRLHPDPDERAAITRDLLEVLRRHRVPAVGFVIWGGVKGPADTALLEHWLAAGFELGNHSSGHLDFTRTDAAAYVADVEKGRAGLQGLLDPRGGRCRLFRFPMLREGDTGDKLDAMRRYLDDSGQRPVPVTIDNQDWSFEEPYVEAVRRGDRARAREIAADYQAALRAAVRHHGKRGDALFGRPVPQILLLHANAIGAAGWDDLFTWLERTGHRFATADEVLRDPAFADPPRFVGRYGPGLWDRIAHVREDRQARDALTRLIDDQAAAWSRGDLDVFCAAYADDALFISPSGTVRGRRAVLDRYRARYPDGAAMGTLRLEIEEIRPLWGMEVTPAGDAVPGSIHGASVAARWTLAYPDRPSAAGRTLLVFRRDRDGWVIVQDASL
jgi:peptidoglycan/xylan/chitin deacetylase (PgdA/CDA1 family)/ketosteroid isomerase-like protein